jgi:TolB-like protein
MGVYLAMAWGVLEAVDHFVGRGFLPEVVYTVVLLFCGFGLPGVFIVSWFHGAKGRQEMPTAEVWLLSALAIVALTVSGFVVKRDISLRGRSVLESLSPTEDPRRIAVLYFEDRSAGGELRFLADGLTETLIDELSQVQALHVVSRNGVALFRDVNVPTDSIARTLEVGSLVQGTVAGSEERLRVNVALVNAMTGAQFASRTLERPRTELFELQDELAEEVSLFLRERLGEEVLQIQRRARTDNVDAWEMVQRAEEAERDAESLRSAGDPQAASRRLLVADSILAEAEALDEDWVRPVTQRGWLAYRQARLGGFDRTHYEEWIDIGMGQAERALEKSSSDPDALELRATLRYWRYLLNLVEGPDESAHLFETAEADFRASVQANPDQASAWSSLSHLLANKLAIAEAKLAALRSYEADPYLTNANLTVYRLFQASVELEDPIEARNWCQEGRRRFPTDYRFVECQLWRLTMRGQEPDLSRAWDLLDEFVELSPPSVEEFSRHKGGMLVAMALARGNLPDSARSVAERARADPSVDPVRELAYLESITRTWVGDYDEALRLLGTFIAANPGQRDSFARDQSWWLEDLRTHPRYRSLVGAEG